MEKPNFIECLLAALNRFDDNADINKKEIALYITLFRVWNRTFFREVITPSRAVLRKQSKIGNNNTLIAALKNLQSSGVLSLKEKEKQSDLLQIKMTRVFVTIDIPTEANQIQDYDTNDTPHVKSETPIISLVTPYIKQENYLLNNLKKEKKENEIENVKKGFEKYFES